MARRSRLVIAKSDIERYFKESQQRVYSYYNLKSVLSANRALWSLPQRLSTKAFLEFLLDRTVLREMVLTSPHYKDLTRYAWGDVSPLEIALSLDKKAYLSHGTAVFLHGLTDELPHTLYVNREQSGTGRTTPLSQAGLDRAFASKQRQSKNTYTVGAHQIVVVAGKFTDRLEVGEVAGPSGERLVTTKLARTLIDIVVRPVYAGGVYQVLEAFKAARESVSVNTLVATLRKLDYAYPYQQAIGFYMERAGYDEQRLELLRRAISEFDFYLTYGMQDTEYDEGWKLFFPKGF